MKSSRRDFISKVTLAALSAGVLSQIPTSLLSAHEKDIVRTREDLDLYHKLLKEWCDALIHLQGKDVNAPETYGGFNCPACGFIHGRSADAAFPLLYMADYTKDQKYKNAAIAVFDWAERNASMPDGSWVNDVKGNHWQGITVFGAIALGESLKHHAHLLDEKTRKQWTARLRKACDFLYGFITVDVSNINYPLCSSYAFALGGKLLDEPKFTAKAKEFSHVFFKYRSPENKFIYGELKPKTQSADGFWPVDLSYNVEETLPMLTLYGLEMKDEELLRAVTETWNTHLEFMLPDGGWDDSFGTRNHKWTYWGSRNSDGCQAGLALLSSRNPALGEAAYRNAKMLEACTHDGILYGGPDYVSHGVPPCIHHTFAHVKSLATVLNDKSIREQAFTRTALPREKITGLKTFKDIGTYLISAGKWRATVTSNDCAYKVSPHASGGSLSLLWHADLGLLLTDSLFPELKLRERTNMQGNSDALQLLLTPRLELQIDGVPYRSSSDQHATVTAKASDDRIRVSANGKFLSNEWTGTPGKQASFHIDYLFKDSGIEINATVNDVPENAGLAFYLPVVSVNKERFDVVSSNKMVVHKPKGDLHVATTGKLNILKGDKNRVFSQSPGVEAIPLKIDWDSKNEPKLNLIISA